MKILHNISLLGICLFVSVFITSCQNSPSKSDTDATIKPTPDSTVVAKQAEPIKDTLPATAIQWIDSTFKDIGIIKGKDSATIVYRFKNTGDQPLVIEGIRTSCGCTVADSHKEPVLPGKESKIRVKFYAGDQAVAIHEKQVYVLTNTIPYQAATLTFKVEVKE